MADLVRTLQDNIKSHTKDLTKFSSTLGGINAKHAALEQVNPLISGFGRIFIMRMPVFLQVALPDKTKKFKHVLEYNNTSITGLGTKQLEFTNLQGGYAGNSLEIPTILKDDTSSLTITVTEYSGSPIRDYVSTWLNGIADQMSGLSHYNGARIIDPTIENAQVNHSMEAIYVSTDQTGDNIEYACLHTNMVPKTVPLSQFDYESGTHDKFEFPIEFTTTKYESSDINEIAKLLLDKYKIHSKYYEIISGYTAEDISKRTVPDIVDWK